MFDTETIEEVKYNTITCTIILKDGTKKVYTGKDAKNIFDKYKEPLPEEKQNPENDLK